MNALTGQEEYSYRDLTTIPEFEQVFALEQAVWGLPNGDEAVPVSLFAAAVKCGAILVGAFDQSARLVGFVYSFPALFRGRLIQWSHMLGVEERHRAGGIGRRLKMEQRSRALAQGIDAVAWTFDPLQAGNASFNLNVLGAEAREYLEDVYGESDSPLLSGAATDRLVAEWHLAGARPGIAAGHVAVGASAIQPHGAPAQVHRVGRDGDWVVPLGEPDLALDAPTLGIRVPPRFTAMLRERPDLARAWRDATRRSFSVLFARGYRAVAFDRDPQGLGGAYVLASDK